MLVENCHDERGVDLEVVGAVAEAVQVDEGVGQADEHRLKYEAAFAKAEQAPEGQEQLGKADDVGRKGRRSCRRDR